MNYDLDYLRKVTQLTTADMEKLEKYWFNLSRLEKIEAEKLKGDLYFQNKDKHFDKTHKAEFSYACLLLALQKMHQLDPALATRKALKDLTPEERKLQYKRQLARIVAFKESRNSPKKTFILSHYDEFEEMRALGFSWRDLSSYIAKNFSKKIGRVNTSYLRETMSAERKRREALKERIVDE